MSMNDNRITKEQIIGEIATTRYLVDGTLTLAIVTMRNGFKQVGESACVDPANFDKDLGEKYALENAISHLWKPMGYALLDQNFEHAAVPAREERGEQMVEFNAAERIARVCHEVNRAYCQALGDNSQPSWEDAPEWQRSSARMGVDLHIMGDFGPEASHLSWMQQKLDEGWVYGEIKDAGAKTHPCIRPFAELPREQQAKDFIFRGVVHAMR